MNYFADTPDGAWAEFLRHEEIRDPADLASIHRALWAVDIGDEAAKASAEAEASREGGSRTLRTLSPPPGN